MIDGWRGNIGANDVNWLFVTARETKGAEGSYDTPDLRTEIETIFSGALDVPDGSREAWLDERCGHDPELRRQVERLLAEHELPGPLDVPLSSRLATALETPMDGRQIGPYRVQRELGRGGMGVVYLADRQDGQFRQRVAVKVLRTSSHRDELTRRFLAERQILASLSHPNIAQLLDGGVEGELPYIVMEYIDGLPITDYCDRHRLGVEERLQLFQDVCAAVHHAHQNLVLHRDLKPGNILVTVNSQVKLLDFGIAKLLNPVIAGSEQPLTRTTFRPMTPAYASPEQVRGDSLTTASDVYTLGLVLYELLTGSKAHRIDSDTPQSMVEAICEREPERASTRVADDTAAAEARDTTPEKLRRRLQGDIDAILAMALRKEPGRRYGSPDLLATDIARYLDGLPVLAHRGSRWYRLEKLLRRHRAEAMIAGGSMLLLLVGTVVSLRLASVAARERDRAATALGQTQRALGESEAVTAFLVDLFEASSPDEGRRDALTASDLLQRGVSRAQRLGTEPLAQARMFEALGRVQASLGNLAVSADFLRRALSLRREHLGVDHAATASVGAQLAEVRRRQGQYAAADTLGREALRARRVTLGDAHQDVAESLRQLAGLSVYFNDLPAAEAFQREAVDVDRRAGPAGDSALVRDLERLGGIRWRRGDDVGAERDTREALRIAQRLFNGPHADRVFVTLRLADRLDEWPGTRAEAESLYRAALEDARAVFGDEHPETAFVIKQLGQALARRGERVEGERLMRQALALQRRTWGSSHAVVGTTMLDLAALLTVERYSAEAEQLARESIALWETAVGTRHTSYAAALGYLAHVIARRGALDSAETLYRRAIEIRSASIGPSAGITALTKAGLAGVLTEGRRFAEAETLYREAIAALRSYTSNTHIDVRRTYAGLAALLDAWGKRDSAAAYRRLAEPPDQRRP